ncbi:hypothetical protein L3X38_024507 [Prunus dulcis]|uniref:HAT C-terminal dimerisation domain-containing protein n=1 Tax=Prunus dulcis TaxID=3755 RepID=A0AAD4Z6K2_PRUDU|nr:hypothetical protein L3X38_024507 [Prunus dulcis]
MELSRTIGRSDDSSKQSRIKINMSDLHYDPGLRTQILDYNPNICFNEANTELLLCLACLSPNDSFSSFDKQKLIWLAQIYPNDFSTEELKVLKDQLQTYIDDMHSNTNFSGLQGIATLAKKLVETKKDKPYPLVYLLIKLALTLPVATASVEREFSAMNIVKNRMLNRMRD